MASEVPRDELKAALAARRELGEEYESALVESFMEKVDQAVEARVQAQLAQAQSAGKPGAAARAAAQASHQQFVLGIVSLGIGIPVTAIAGGTSGVAGLVASWGGIAAVNVAYALRARWDRPPVIARTGPAATWQAASQHARPFRGAYDVATR